MASKRHQRNSACTGKIRYPDRVRAHKAMVGLAKRRNGYRLNFYKCKFCNGYHLGNSNPIVRTKAKYVRV
jgi:hypothetical protein